MALLCAATGGLGLLLSYDHSHAAVVWLPAGIALAGVLLLGYRVWPGILLGHAALALGFDLFPWEWVASLAGSPLAALLGASLLRHWRDFDPRLPRIRDLLALLLLGGVVPAFFKAVLVLLGFELFGAGDGAGEESRWLIWWMGDSAGVLLAAPLLLLLAAERAKAEWIRETEGWLALLALALLAFLSISEWLPLAGAGDVPLAVLPIPCLVWIAIRLPLYLTALAMLLVTLISMLGGALGQGPFFGAPVTEGAVLLWSYLIGVGTMTLLFSVAMTTQRRQTEQLRQIVEANPNAILLTDGEGVIRQANSRCKPLFGYEPRELLGQPVELLLPASLGQPHMQYRKAFMASPEARPMGTGRDLFARRRDGFEVPVEVGLSPVQIDGDGCVLAAITDISERKRAEETLREERNFLSALLDTTDALVVVQDHRWRIQRFNRACQAVSGYTEDEARGRSVWELGLIPEGERPGVNTVAEGLLAGRLHGYWENHWRDRHGELHLIAWSSNFVQDADGGIQYLIGTGIEITERRRAEDELRQWQRRQVRMDRLATAAELASGLAHELNQPLTAISSYCDVAMMLGRAAPDRDDKLLEVIGKAEQQAQRAGSIIRHLRDFVGKAGSDNRRVDLNALIRETLEFIDGDIRRNGATVELTLDEGLPPLWLDRVQIEQVLVNLVRNACEAMAAADSDPRSIHIATALAADDQVRVSVRDSGPGLDPAIAEKPFRPFETTKPNGLGMGLAISRSIVEARCGRLWVESAPGGGSLFHFTLPITPTGDSRDDN